MHMVRHVWEPHAMIDFTQVADSTLLNSIPFDMVTPLTFEAALLFEANKDTVINSVYLTSNTILTEGIEVGDTSALNAPVVFPMEYDVEVSKGDKVKMSVAYQFGGGFRNFKVDITRLEG
jgi:predicted RNA methylase